MFMQKEDRKAIYTVLFRSGVMFAERAPHKMHSDKELKHLTNLKVIKTLKSLKSQGYVTEQAAWCHYYWCLRNEGIEYLRAYLHIPPDVVPTTLQRNEPVRAPRASKNQRSSEQRDNKQRDDRGVYRRTERLENSDKTDKTGNVGAGSAPVEFRGGFGRGNK